MHLNCLCTIRPLHGEGDGCELLHTQLTLVKSFISTPASVLAFIGPKTAINKSRPDNTLLFGLYKKESV